MNSLYWLWISSIDFSHTNIKEKVRDSIEVLDPLLDAGKIMFLEMREGKIIIGWYTSKTGTILIESSQWFCENEVYKILLKNWWVILSKKWSNYLLYSKCDQNHVINHVKNTVLHIQKSTAA